MYLLDALVVLGVAAVANCFAVPLQTGDHYVPTVEGKVPHTLTPTSPHQC